MSYLQGTIHPTPLTDDEGRRLAPDEIWERWMGDQTPAEFMARMRARVQDDALAADTAVDIHMDERYSQSGRLRLLGLDAYLTDDEWADVANSLAAVIKQAEAR